METTNSFIKRFLVICPMHISRSAASLLTLMRVKKKSRKLSQEKGKRNNCCHLVDNIQCIVSLRESMMKRLEQAENRYCFIKNFSHNILFSDDNQLLF